MIARLANRARRALQRLDALLLGLSETLKRAIASSFVATGVCALVYYFAWWVEGGRFLRPALAPLFLFAVVCAAFQLLTGWYAYLRIEIPAPRRAPEGLRVDVLVPVYKEDAELVAETLAAAVAIRYPHRTILLDDAASEDHRRLAARLGAGYVRRSGHADAKAGNVNHALATAADADFVTIFDVDHVPLPGFLDEVLGHFDDPKVGFVQALVAHRNQGETVISRASSGQADDVFGPTSMGWNGCGAALVWGAHCTFRRAALDSIGGYRPGLAEDLQTSLALHGRGWRSVYVPRVVARGLTTSDLAAHFVQHLKWSRGVLGALLEGGIPKLVRLGASQAACYLTRMTYYLIGPVVLLHMLLLAFALHTGRDVHSYLTHALPLLATTVLLRKAMGAMWEQDPRAGWQLTGTALALSTWPVYFVSLVAACLRIPLAHLPTPKRARGGNFLPLVAPQLALATLLATGIGRAIARGLAPHDVLTVGFASAMLAAHSVLVVGVWEGWKLPRAVELRPHETGRQGSPAEAVAGSVGR